MKLVAKFKKFSNFNKLMFVMSIISTCSVIFYLIKWMQMFMSVKAGLEIYTLNSEEHFYTSTSFSPSFFSSTDCLNSYWSDKSITDYGSDILNNIYITQVRVSFCKTSIYTKTPKERDAEGTHCGYLEYNAFPIYLNGKTLENIRGGGDSGQFSLDKLVKGQTYRKTQNIGPWVVFDVGKKDRSSRQYADGSNMANFIINLNKDKMVDLTKFKFDITVESVYHELNSDTYTKLREFNINSNTGIKTDKCITFTLPFNIDTSLLGNKDIGTLGAPEFNLTIIDLAKE